MAATMKQRPQPLREEDLAYSQNYVPQCNSVRNKRPPLDRSRGFDSTLNEENEHNLRESENYLKNARTGPQKVWFKGHS